MPWIEKRGKSQVVRWETVNPDGSTTTHSSKHLTEPKAKAMVKVLRAKIPDRRKRKAGVRVHDHSIHDLCTQWKAAKLQGGQKSANYAEEAAKRAEAVADAAGILTVSQATPAAIRAHRTATGTASHRPLSYLRAVLRWACDELGIEIPRAFFVAARPPPSIESEHRVLSETEAARIEAKARELDQWPLVRCLMLYGWRPITACRILVRHVDLAAKPPTIQLAVKRAKKPHVHPLHPEVVDLLRPLVKDRAPDDPLFLARFRRAWLTRGDKAEGLTRWYHCMLRPLAPECGGTNALKRWALDRMDRGLSPWERPLTLREIRLFTGHKTDSQAARYLRPNVREAARLVSAKHGGSVVEVAKPSATRRGFTATAASQIDIEPDDSVTYSA